MAVQEQSPKISVGFICTGNICRSPMAEAVFRHMVDEAGLSDRFEIFSAATTSWEIGNPPHPGTQLALRDHHIPLDPRKRAQRITPADCNRADYLLVMDNENMEDMVGCKKAALLLDVVPTMHGREVPDPYYTGDFEGVFRLITRGCQLLLEKIRREKNL